MPVLFALAVPLTGFASVRLLAGAIHNSRNPYLLADLDARKITTVRAGRRRSYQRGPGERFAVECGEAGSGDSFISGERLVIIRADGRRSPTDLWGTHAHPDDWASLTTIRWGR